MTTVSATNSKLLYGNRPLAKADGVETIAVKVKLRDSTNKPVANTQVELTADRDGVEIEQPGPTNEEGYSLGLVRAITPGVVTISCAVLPTE